MEGFILYKLSFQPFSAELPTFQEDVRMEFTGTNLDKKDMLGKSDPYLQIEKENSDGTLVLVLNRLSYMYNCTCIFDLFYDDDTSGKW